MTSADQLTADILTAKTNAIALALKFVNLEANGEAVGNLSNQLIVATSKISNLEDFYCQNFDDFGNVIVPTFTCASNTLIKTYINPNYTPPNTDITINTIDGGVR